MYGKGTVSINAENIMPVIKQWLYSDKDIFIRELVSNGCDAISKHKRLVSTGEAVKDDAPYRVDVVVDKEAGTLSFSDNGIGMTAEEVEKYIAQVAFSGAADFISKYASQEGDDETKIIGHFGLGFYSCFMVSDKVVVESKSYTDAPAVRWISTDGMEYETEESDRTERGTTITLTISESDKDFLNLWTVRETLEKHCAFMPVPIYLSEIKPPKPESEEKTGDGEGKPEEVPAEPEQINDTNPLWMRKPTDCTDEDYKEFYRKVFHDYEEPLFWIHLNAEYPFNLKGILYFPRIKNEFSASEGMVKLYNNQVFVADNIKEVIPEFLLLLKGVIDCPDLPLNVSRSFLQNDGYVKKMAAYITRKVADRLTSEFNNKREDYQRYWDDIHPFVKYGCIKDEKFYDRVKKALLFKTTAGEYLTLEEYRTRNADGEECTVYYASDEKRQAQMIKLYTDQGKDVVLLDTLIDNNYISFLEYAERDSKITLKRIDAAADGLTGDGKTSEDDRKLLETRFRAAVGDDTLEVQLKPFKSNDMIAMITVDEQNRRFAEMSARWGGKDMVLPEKRTLVLNASHPLVSWIKDAEEDGDLTRSVCAQVADLAEMARQPLVADRMVEFLKRSNALLTMVIQK